MLRRRLLQSIAVVPIALAGCSLPTAVPQIVDDVSVIASGLKGLLPSLTTIVGVSADTVTKVQGWIGEIQSVASVVAAATTATPALATTLAGLVGQVASALTGKPLPAWASTVLAAAQALLPVVMTVAGVALAGPKPTMTAAQARAVLRAAS